ncbi:MAG: S24 family peptidase [Luteolibacter sp.]|uniref:LexA family protein n=1 Tax=Luteolibacter sp. TaxID=1962973 RepID=UPI0032674902
METFAERLTWSIERSGLGRPEFAVRAGAGTSALAKWLAGKLMPKSEQMLGIARAANVSMEWLISGEGPRDSGTAFVSMLGKIKDLSSEYHPNDPASQERFVDFLTDAINPVVSIMSERKDAVELKTGDRRIPVLGWAHAGAAAVYEEIAVSHRQTMPTDCRDPKAFGVILEGDSMEDSFREKDQLVLMPGEEAYSGCLAVCRFVDDGVVFRRLEFMGNQVRLMPLNPRYESTTHQRSDFSWIYPIWESRRQIWK